MSELKELLGEELFSQLEAALQGKGKDGKDVLLAVANDGSYVPKAKFDEVCREMKDWKEKAGDSSSAVAENGRLRQELETLRFDTVLDQALMTAKARNRKAVRALLDTEQLGLDENGTLTGLSEQLDALRKSDAFLFEGERQEPYRPAAGGDIDFSRMSDRDYYNYMKKKG